MEEESEVPVVNPSGNNISENPPVANKTGNKMKTANTSMATNTGKKNVNTPINLNKSNNSSPPEQITTKRNNIPQNNPMNEKLQVATKELEEKIKEVEELMRASEEPKPVSGGRRTTKRGRKNKKSRKNKKRGAFKI